MPGVLIALIAGVFLGLFQSLHGNAENLPVRTGTMLLLAMAAILVNAVTVATSGISAYTALSGRAVLFFAIAGAIHFSGGWMFIGLAQRRVGVGITGLLVGATPVFTAIIAWTILGESLSVKDLAGVGLVVAGVGVATWR